MPIIESTSSKKFYTRKDDEAIVAGLEAKQTVEQIGTTIGHSPASVQYRIQRVLRNPAFKTLDDVSYKGAAKVTPAAAKDTKGSK